MGFLKSIFGKGNKGNVDEGESIDYYDNRESFPMGIPSPPADDGGFEGGYADGGPPAGAYDAQSYMSEDFDEMDPLEAISEANTSETSSWHPAASRQSGASRSTATSYRSQSSMFEYGAPHIGRESTRSSAYTQSRPVSEYSDASSQYTQSRPQSEYSEYTQSQYSQTRPQSEYSEYSEYSDYPESEYSEYTENEGSRPPTLPPRQDGTLGRLNEVATKLESYRDSKSTARSSRSSRMSRSTRGPTSYRGSRATTRSRASQYTKQSQSRPQSQYSEYSDYSDYSESDGGYTRPQSEYSQSQYSEYDDGSSYSQSRPQSEYSEWTEGSSRPQSEYSEWSEASSRPQSAMTDRTSTSSYRPASSKSSRFSGRSRRSRTSGRSSRTSGRSKSGRSVWSRRSKAQSRMVSRQLGIKPIPEEGEYDSRVNSYATDWTQEGGRGASMPANGGVRVESQKGGAAPENLVVGSPSRYYKKNGRWVATQSTRINFVPMVLRRVTMNVQALGFGGKLAVKREDPKEHYFDASHQSGGSNGSDKDPSYVGPPPKTLQKAIRDPNAKRAPIPSQWTRVVTNHWQNFRMSLMPKRNITADSQL